MPKLFIKILILAILMIVYLPVGFVFAASETCAQVDNSGSTKVYCCSGAVVAGAQCASVVGGGPTGVSDASNAYYVAKSNGSLNTLTAGEISGVGITKFADTFIAPASSAAALAAVSRSSSSSSASSLSSSAIGAPAATGAVTLNSPIKCGGVDCDLAGVITGIMNFVFTIALIICPIFIVWGGFEIATAAGSEEKVKNGREIITYALVGLVIIAVSKGFVEAIKSIL